METLELVEYYQIDHQTVTRLADACCAETMHQSDNGSCFELLRQAIEASDGAAWQAIYTQYNRLLLHWIRRFFSRPLTNETAEDLAQSAWLKFWRQMSKPEPPFSKRFSHMGGVLNYLKKCAVTACLERQRKEKAQARILARVDSQLKDENAYDSVREYLQEIDVEDRVNQVSEWLDANVHDKTERVVIQLTYRHHLTPAEIVLRMPHLFSHQQDVYRIKQRVLKRARRALLDDLK